MRIVIGTFKSSGRRLLSGWRRFGTACSASPTLGNPSVNCNRDGIKLPLFSRFLEPSSSNIVAFTDCTGRNFTFLELGSKSTNLANELRSILPPRDPGEGDGERIAFLLDKDSSVPITLGATWWAQHVAMPLSPSHPENMLEYFLQSTGSKLIVTNGAYADRMSRVAKAVGAKLHVVDFDKLKSDPGQNDKHHEPSLLDPGRYEGKGAVILFTSGTTGKPKGVLLTHSNILAQVETICHAFEIGEGDTLLHVLPLHHTHGLIHALISPLSNGARCHMLEKFDPGRTWEAILSPDEMRPTVLMGVPTVYVKLIEEYDKSFGGSSLVRETCQEKMRLFLSGSASLPVPIIERVEEITGHRILERYGMTEVGVILMNPLNGRRRPGFVGLPFGTVEVMVADLKSKSGQHDRDVLAIGSRNKMEVKVEPGQEVVGDLLVKGPSVFKEYWGNPEATTKEFTEDGWFITGDSVQYVDEGEGEGSGSIKILGRKSVDIIKSGGYKLSALEIETQLLSLPQIREVTVLGIPDPTWGQRVAAVVVWNGRELDAIELKQLAKSRLAHYAVPTVIKSMAELPKNHLGKVNKKEMAKLFR